MKKINFLKVLAFFFVTVSGLNAQTQTPFVQWNFNNDTTNTFLGTGTLTLVGGVTSAFVNGTGSSDPDRQNRAFNTTSYAPMNTGNKERGIQMNVSTAGYSDIVLTFDQRLSNAANSFYTVQYTTDVTASSVVWTDMQTLVLIPAATGVADTWHNSRVVDFSTVTALNNNVNVAFRIVSSYDPRISFCHSLCEYYAAANSNNTYATTGTVRYDMITFSGTVAAVPSLSLTPSTLNFDQILGAPSKAQPVSVTGANLTANIDLTVTPPFEIALTENGTYAGTQILALTGGGYSGDVYVRLNSSAQNNSITGTLTAQTAGISPNIVVNLNGDADVSQVTNPAPFDLSTGDYTFDQWDDTSASGIYPDNMMFWINDAGNGVESTDADWYFYDWECVYDAAAGSRILGEGVDGVSFLNEDDPITNEDCHDDPSLSGRLSGKPGAAVLALNTLDRKDIQVDWTGRTIAPNSQIYALKLQYRIGDGNGNPNIDWQDFAAVSEYTAETTAGDFQNLSAVLPSSAEDQAVVQLRWVYFEHSSNTAIGSRAQLALDEITVSSTSLSTKDFEKNSLVMYPNPSSDIVNFDTEITGVIYDLNGKKVLSFENTASVNISQLTKGVYVVKTNEGATTKLVVK